MRQAIVVKGVGVVADETAGTFLGAARYQF